MRLQVGEQRELCPGIEARAGEDGTETVITGRGVRTAWLYRWWWGLRRERRDAAAYLERILPVAETEVQLALAFEAGRAWERRLKRRDASRRYGNTGRRVRRA